MTKTQEILRLTALGKSSRYIADKLDISIQTVCTIKWQYRNRERTREYARACYHRNKSVSVPTAWTPKEDKILMAMLDSGASFGEIAKRLKRNRNQVAGRKKRLRESEDLAA